MKLIARSIDWQTVSNAALRSGRTGILWAPESEVLNKIIMIIKNNLFNAHCHPGSVTTTDRVCVRNLYFDC